MPLSLKLYDEGLGYKRGDILVIREGQRDSFSDDVNKVMVVSNCFFGFKYDVVVSKDEVKPGSYFSMFNDSFHKFEINGHKWKKESK